ncbi:MAG: NAD-dependent epimerase/dehydratase family protein [Alphaproteobacteria bacterium]|nr:NAD-dependent epimerase/dehydratase family protein [Alphaproteobacteria bacterium]
MKKSILILGGTKFFGRHLTKMLVDAGHDVTVASRRPYEDLNVFYKQIDRQDAIAVKKIASNGWDVVFDQICMNGSDAHIAVEAFSSNCRKYVVSSSIAVYGRQSCQYSSEGKFNPITYNQSDIPTEDTYTLGKREAESILCQAQDLSCIAVRFPIVLGTDDYTERLEAPIRAAIRTGKIDCGSADLPLSVISSKEAAAVLNWVGCTSTVTGSLNATSIGLVRPSDIVREVSRLSKRDIRPVENATPELKSILNLSRDMSADPSRAVKLGAPLTETWSWLSPLLNFYVQSALAE